MGIMRYIIIGVYFLLLPLFLSSMEESFLLISVIAEKNQSIVQQEIRYYFDKTLSEVKLSELGNKYYALSNDARSKLICRMSPELRLLHYIALQLPQDVQEHIYAKMFEENKEIMNIFYDNQPALKAFDLYQSIIKEIGLSKPIAPLYKMKEQERYDTLAMIRKICGGSFAPIISCQEQEKIKTMDKDVQQYFAEYGACVLSEENTEHYESVLSMSFGSSVMTILTIGLSIALKNLNIVSSSSMAVWGIFFIASLREGYNVRKNNYHKFIE
jgi:hypothetical protein